MVMGLAANYTLSGGTHQLTINQRPLNATIQRVYNGGLDARSDFISFDAMQGGETLFYLVMVQLRSQKCIK